MQNYRYSVLVHSVLGDDNIQTGKKLLWKSTHINGIMVPIMEILISLVAQGNVFSFFFILKYLVTVGGASNPINFSYWRVNTINLGNCF